MVDDSPEDDVVSNDVLYFVVIWNLFCAVVWTMVNKYACVPVFSYYFQKLKEGVLCLFKRQYRTRLKGENNKICIHFHVPYGSCFLSFPRKLR